MVLMVLMSTERSPDVSFSTCLIPGGQMSAWPRRSSIHHHAVHFHICLRINTEEEHTNEERPLTDLRHIRVPCIRPRDRPSSPRRPMSRR